MLLYEDHKPAVVYTLAFAPDGSALASGAKDGALLVRNLSGHTHAITESGPTNPAIHAVAYTADGAGLILAGPFGWLESRNDGPGNWDVLGPKKAIPVTALGLLDERTLAIGTGDRVKPSSGSFELWDLPTRQRREPHFDEPNGVRAIATCPDRKMVAWTTGHKKVCVWEVTKQDPVVFPQPKNSPALSLNPEGTQVVVAMDYVARVFDIANRRQRLELKGHKGRIEAVTFSPDGSTIATGSWDLTVKLWDAATGRERASFNWDIGRIYSLAYAPDGLRLAAGGDTGQMVVWDLD